MTVYRNSTDMRIPPRVRPSRAVVPIRPNYRLMLSACRQRRLQRRARGGQNLEVNAMHVSGYRALYELSILVDEYCLLRGRAAMFL